MTGVQTCALPIFPGISVKLLATVKNSCSETALHVAAYCGFLAQIPGLTAELLATDKNNCGQTPLHIAANNGFLAQLGNLTLAQVTALNIRDDALAIENISALTEDFRRNGTHYNNCHTIKTALLDAANQLPHLEPANRTAVKAALCAAQEGGFVLPPETLAHLL